jgi:hypothetical protein
MAPRPKAKAKAKGAGGGPGGPSSTGHETRSWGPKAARLDCPKVARPDILHSNPNTMSTKTVLVRVDASQTTHIGAGLGDK